MGRFVCKKFIKPIIGLALFLTSMQFGSVMASSIDVSAKSAIVIEAATGKVLFEKAGQEKRYPASTTKIMTLIVALEQGDLQQFVTTSSRASAAEGSTLWLNQGETVQLKDLLYGLMLVSGNDASIAIAEGVGGSVEGFVGMMNSRAAKIGALNTHFVNPNGLPNLDHYTTAKDLAMIAAYGYKIPLFSDIVSTKRYTMPWAGKNYDREFFNENKLLYWYEGANGVKTGYTNAAGPCLVSAAQQNGVQLIAVVLDSDHMWDDSKKLLDYGFSKIKGHSVLEKNTVMGKVRVQEGTVDWVEAVLGTKVVLPAFDDQEILKMVVDLPRQFPAGIKSGQKIGVVRVYLQNKEVMTADLLAAQEVPQRSFFSLLREILEVCSEIIKW